MNYPIWSGTVPYFLPDADTPNSFSFYPADTKKSAPCVVVLPGGGYHVRAAHEGAPVAEFFRANGLHAAVVNYRVEPNRFPAGLTDVQRVIRILRAKADEWKLDPEQIFVCGFSAGGHLAASTALLPDTYEKTDEIDERSPRPNGLILCYTVFSFGKEWGIPGCGKHLLGEERYKTEHKSLCLVPRITKNTPPTFLWHTSDDDTVPVKHSLKFAEALSENDVPFELHIFPHGKHGLGLAPDTEDVREWPVLALRWVHKTAGQSKK